MNERWKRRRRRRVRRQLVIGTGWRSGCGIRYCFNVFSLSFGSVLYSIHTLHLILGSLFYPIFISFIFKGILIVSSLKRKKKIKENHPVSFLRFYFLLWKWDFFFLVNKISLWKWEFILDKCLSACKEIMTLGLGIGKLAY